MLLLQKDRTHGKRLPIRTRRVVETEKGRPGKVCLYHDQGAHKKAERKFHKDGDGGQRQRGFLKQRTGSMSVFSSLSIEHVQVAQIKKNTMTVDILISGESLGQKKIVETTTLLDTRAGGKFINQNFVQNQKIEKKKLKYPTEVFNVNGTPNKWGTITKYTWLDLTINRQMWTHNLLVTGLGKQKIILGYPWFKKTNLDINWKECTLTWQTKQDEKKPTPKTTIENEINPEDWKNHTVNLIEELDDEQIGNTVLLSYIEEAKSKVCINAKTGIAMKLAIKENKKKADLPVKKLIPEDLHNFLTITRQTDSLNLMCGTTRLIWKKDLSQNVWRITIWHQRNKENWTNSWTKFWKKDIFDHFSRLKCHLSSLSRRMEDFDHVKIIDTWTTGWLKTHILYL
jgi:Retroviral aspartyl protease